MKKILLKFLDWWLGRTHWWRPRTRYTSCSVCGHVYVLFLRKEKICYYEELPELKKDKQKFKKLCGININTEKFYSVCNRCGIPKAKGKRRMYISNSNYKMFPINNEAFQFELKRAGELGALFTKDEMGK